MASQLRRWAERLLLAAAVFSLFLTADLIVLAVVGNPYHQHPSLQHFFRILLMAMATALVLGTAVHVAVEVCAALVAKLGKRLRRAVSALYPAALVAFLVATEVVHHARDYRLAALSGLGGAVLIVTWGALRPFRPGPRVLAALPLLLLLLSVGTGLAGLAGRGTDRESRPASSRPNIFLIVVDTTRADHLGCYGYPRETSAFFDGLAARSLHFERAYSASAATTPSTAAILGAPYPYSDDFPENGTRPRQFGLASYLSEQGYATGGFSANPHVSEATGFDAGFDHFRNLDFLEKDFAVTHVMRSVAESVGLQLGDFLRAELLNVRVKAWLDAADPSRPVFCYVHYLDPHYPYTPLPEHRRSLAPNADLKWQRYPEGHKTGYPPFVDGTEIEEAARQAMIALYDAEIAQWDRALSELWEHLAEEGWLENALVIITADHGEAFYDHRSWGHRNTLYEEQIHVPLVVHRSWSDTGQRIGGNVTNTAVISLVSSLVDAHPDRVPDETIVQSLRPPNGRIVAQHSRERGKYRGAAIVEGDDKTIAMRTADEVSHEVFELSADPGELVNVYSAASGAAVNAAMAQIPTPIGEEAMADLPVETEDLLRSLGYID